MAINMAAPPQRPSRPYSPIRAAQRSAAVPWSHAAAAAACTGGRPCPSSETRMPASTSPLPPVARPGLPQRFSQRSSAPQMAVRCPLSSTVAPVFSASAAAAPMRSSPGSLPIRRRYSPSCGVSTTGQAAPRSTSICPSSTFMPSASTTTGQDALASTACTAANVPALLPKPQPIRQASQPESRAWISGTAVSANMPPCARSGNTIGFPATIGYTGSGTPTKISPAPDRAAPMAASAGAPV